MQKKRPRPRGSRVLAVPTAWSYYVQTLILRQERILEGLGLVNKTMGARMGPVSGDSDPNLGDFRPASVPSLSPTLVPG